MGEYKVEITETLQRLVSINADSEDGAISATGKQYADENIVLDAEDFIDVKFEVIK